MIFLNQTPEISKDAMFSSLIIVIYRVLGASVPISIIFIKLLSEKCLLADIMNQSRGVLVSLIGKPCQESAIIIITTLFYIHLVALKSCRSGNYNLDKVNIICQ